MQLPTLMTKLQRTELDTYLEIQTTTLLNRLGVPTNFAGYHYLRLAIVAAYKESTARCSFSKEIYPMIAERYDSSESRVERNIRYAIEATWRLGNRDEIRALFPSMIRRPDNSRFVTRLAEELKLQIAKESYQQSREGLDA